MKYDLHESITNKIVAQLEAGTVPWQRDWSVGGSGVPMNAISNRPYSGVNVLLFWMAQDKGYPTARYLTFKQAKEVGGTVRAGEHGTQVIYFKQLTVKDRSTGDDKKIPLLRGYTVFNVAQCDGLPEYVVNGPSATILNQDEREELADEFIRLTGANFKEGTGQPSYSPKLDCIFMPAFSAFKDKSAFYLASFHELGHWTGAKHRLNRDLSTRFADQSYSVEEIVAELTAAFLASEFGFNSVVPRSASYLASWIKTLESKSADHIRGGICSR